MRDTGNLNGFAVAPFGFLVGPPRSRPGSQQVDDEGAVVGNDLPFRPPRKLEGCRMTEGANLAALRRHRGTQPQRMWRADPHEPAYDIGVQRRDRPSDEPAPTVPHH